MPERIQLNFYRVKVLEIFLLLSVMFTEVDSPRASFKKQQVDVVKEIGQYMRMVVHLTSGQLVWILVNRMWMYQVLGMHLWITNTSNMVHSLVAMVQALCLIDTLMVSVALHLVQGMYLKRIYC